MRVFSAPPPPARPAPFRDPAAAQETRRQVLRIVDLPTLPTVVPTVYRLLEDPRTSARDLAKVIASDQALASRILRLANSAFYGFPREITSVNHAVVILGFETVKSIVLATSVFDALSGGEGTGPFDRQQLWLHAVATGAASRFLGRGRGAADVETAFVSGLLHDIGKVALDRSFPDRYREVARRVADRHVPLREGEALVFGVDHAEIGRWLAERWRLPQVIVEAVAFHHRPAEASASHADLVGVVHVADILARNAGIGSGGDPQVPLPDAEVLARLGAGPDHLARWTDALAAEAPAVDAFFREMR